MQTRRGCGETAQGQGTNHSGRNRAKPLGVAEMARHFQKSRLHSGYDWVQGLLSAEELKGTPQNFSAMDLPSSLGLPSFLRTLRAACMASRVGEGKALIPQTHPTPVNSGRFTTELSGV